MKVANVTFVIGTADEVDDMLKAIEEKLHWEHFLRLSNQLKPECAKLCKEAPIGIVYVAETGNVHVTESVMVEAFIEGKDTRKELVKYYNATMPESMMKHVTEDMALESDIANDPDIEIELKEEKKPKLPKKAPIKTIQAALDDMKKRPSGVKNIKLR